MLPPNEYVVSVQSADIMQTAFQLHRANRIFEFPSCAYWEFLHHWRSGDTSPARDIAITYRDWHYVAGHAFSIFFVPTY